MTHPRAGPAPGGIEFATLREAASMLRRGAVSSVELTRLMLARIEALDGRLNAFVTVTGEQALRQAARADAELARGDDRGVLHGIPIAVKDLFATAGVRTTCGSAYYKDWVPDHDAAAVSRLLDAGAVLLGKTGMHEMAWGSTSINPFFGAVANPWNFDCHAGGSSGGSAAAVAAGMAYAALGSDTGCSVRQPAQCCGIVGLKPSFGLVSKTGAIPLVWSMDHVGPLTRDVADAAAVLQALAGYDPDDPYSVDRPRQAFDALFGEPVGGTVIGVPVNFFFDGGDAEVTTRVRSALDVLEGLGARLREVEAPEAESAFAAAGVTFCEALAAHADAWRDRPEAFSPSIHHKMHQFAQRTGAEYAAAQHLRQRFRRLMAELMTQCDALAAPTSTVSTAPIAAQPEHHRRERWKNTALFNFTGQPSVSVPCGFTTTGLPVGLMISGPMFGDARVLQVARAYEQATDWHCRHPALLEQPDA